MNPSQHPSGLTDSQKNEHMKEYGFETREELLQYLRDCGESDQQTEDFQRYLKDNPDIVKDFF